MKTQGEIEASRFEHEYMARAMHSGSIFVSFPERAALAGTCGLDSITPNMGSTCQADLAGRLDACGWSSFDPRLFAGEASRVDRDTGPSIVAMLRDFSCGRRVLDLCCGTGSLCLFLARAGYQVTGVDLSPGMLQIFRESSAAEPDDVRARVRVVQGDVCSFDLRETFDFILLEDDSFVYLHTREDQLACLSRAQEHLGGHGHFFLQFTTPQRELLADEDYEYDEVRQIKTLPCEWTILDKQGREHRIGQGVQRRRLTWPSELELLLDAAGLQIIHRWGDLDRTPFKDPDFQEYCYLMRRSS